VPITTLASDAFDYGELNVNAMDKAVEDRKLQLLKGQHQEVQNGYRIPLWTSFSLTLSTKQEYGPARDVDQI